MKKNKDIVLKINVRDAYEDFLGGTVEIRLEHTRLKSELRELRAVDASSEIAISGLRRGPKGIYKVSVTRADPWMKKDQVGSIPSSGRFFSETFASPSDRSVGNDVDVGLTAVSVLTAIGKKRLS